MSVVPERSEPNDPLHWPQLVDRGFAGCPCPRGIFGAVWSLAPSEQEYCQALGRTPLAEACTSPPSSRAAADIDAPHWQ